MNGACKMYGRREVRTEFWYENLKQSDNLEDLVMDGSKEQNLILEKYNRKALTRLKWLRMWKRNWPTKQDEFQPRT
jgi:hypothetical protein